MAVPTGTLRLDLPLRNPNVYSNGRVVVYGNDTFDDFGGPGNFYRKGEASCGGNYDSAIVAPASAYTGQVKTGKYRRLTLPGQPGPTSAASVQAPVLLVFAIGIEDGYVSKDGVRFRVAVRDHADRTRTEVYSREWRLNVWSNDIPGAGWEVVDLTPWAGQTVDLFFETHAISDTTGDQSAWRRPRIITQGG